MKLDRAEKPPGQLQHRWTKKEVIVIIATSQHEIIFWVIMGFFILIGIIAILTITGVIKTDPRFHKWAVGGFAAAVVGVVIVWAKSAPPAPPPPSMDFYVTLSPPQNVPKDSFELVNGTYEYDDSSSSQNKKSHSGPVQITCGQVPGSWIAKFQLEGTNSSKAFRLLLNDSNGQKWRVRPFYPNYISQSLVATISTQEKARINLPSLNLVPEVFAGENLNLRFNNYSKFTSSNKKNNFYKWKVFVDEPFEKLKDIAEVQYELHPTFIDPVQWSTNMTNRFAIDAEGWGEFKVFATIRYKNGILERGSYYLNLNKGWPRLGTNGRPTSTTLKKFGNSRYKEEAEKICAIETPLPARYEGPWSDGRVSFNTNIKVNNQEIWCNYQPID